MAKQYRQGPVGALMDEYERALDEYKGLIASISAEDFVKILDPVTTDPDCKSVQKITNHVVRAGYGYSNYIRKQFNDAFVERKEDYELHDTSKANKELDNMMAYALETMQNKWNITEQEVMSNIIKTQWGQSYDFEQLLEHAIVHILRHRRQIEKLTQK
jgi:uncharacterized damage-inducible protein DinB